MLHSVCLFLLLLLPVLAHAATYYVGTSGNDGNSCGTAQSSNAGSRKRSINAGVACMSGGDTVIVGDGTYNETLVDNIPPGSSGARTVVKSETFRGAQLRPDNSKPRGGNVAIISIGRTPNRNYITIQDLVVDGSDVSPPAGLLEVIGESCDTQIIGNEFRNVAHIDDLNNSNGMAIHNACTQGHGNLIQGNWIHDIGYIITGSSAAASHCTYENDSYITFENNIFERCGSYGIHGYAGVATVEVGVIIRNNIIRYNHGPGILQSCPGHDNYIYNNIIHNNGDQHIQGDDGILLGAFCAGNPTGPTFVYNNTIVDNAGDCVQVGDPNTATGVRVRNNICYQNGFDGVRLCGGAQGCSDNIENQNLFGSDPFFVNAGAGDYRVLSGSPAINAGANLSSVFTTDKSGATRPSSGNWTIGAYEFGGTVSLPAPTNFRVTGN